MKITAIQMDMRLGDTDYNFYHAKELIKRTANEETDIIVLPEMWNTGFFPHENLKEICDRDGSHTQEIIGALAKEQSVNIVAGSVSNMRKTSIYNTSFIFDRCGEKIAEYDKVHLFSPMEEDNFFEKGNSLCTFEMDNIKCGAAICYDIRFPEYIRMLALCDIKILFVMAQWPIERAFHLKTLAAARAIENQMFVVCVNSCAQNDNDKFAGSSMIISPSGKLLANCGEKEEIITAEIDVSEVDAIRNSVTVYNDRRTELYDIN